MWFLTVSVAGLMTMAPAPVVKVGPDQEMRLLRRVEEKLEQQAQHRRWHRRQRRIAAQQQPPEPTEVVAPAPKVAGDIYDQLASCESGMDPTTNTGNGYYGAFQFLPSTWNSLGLSGLPTDHSYDTQKQAAIALIARSGWGQFPGCAAQLGVL